MHSPKLVREFNRGAILCILACIVERGEAATLMVHGSPGYTPGVGGYIASAELVDGINFSVDVNNAGVAIGRAPRYDASGFDRDVRSLRWSASDATVLGDLGTLEGRAFTAAHAINEAGVAAGGATIGFGADQAVRWNGPGAEATQLASPPGASGARLQDINDSGVSLGMANVGIAVQAVRWDASGSPTTLPPIPGSYNYEAYDINNAGTALGRAFDGSTDRGVRWDAAGTPSELGHLGLDASGGTVVQPQAMNSAGTAVGYAFKHDGTGNFQGTVPVRWDASSSTAIELDTPGPTVTGFSFGDARDINDVGAAVGTVIKSPAFPTDEFGTFPARWNASGTSVTLLGHLGSAPNGDTFAEANAINSSGLIVGSAGLYNPGSGFHEPRAVYWRANGLAVDLNARIDPASGWLLSHAYAVSDTAWIAGLGTFDPDGPGGQDAYGRYFLLQLPATNAGDFDSDGVVDGTDFLKWQRGESPTPMSMADLADWRNNFGVVPIAQTERSVPEPSTLLLLAIAPLYCVLQGGSIPQGRLRVGNCSTGHWG